MNRGSPGFGGPLASVPVLLASFLFLGAQTSAALAPVTPGPDTDFPRPVRDGLSARNDTTVMGIVRDAEDGRPLPGVFLRIQDTEVAVVSDSSGAFSLKGVPVGRHTLLCDALGYAPLAVPFEVPPPGRLLEIALTPSPIELAPLEVRVDLVTRQLDARLRASRNTARVAGSGFLREMDEVLDPKFALFKMGLSEGDCTFGDCLRMFGKSKPVSTIVDDRPVSFEEFRLVPIRDLCRVEALYHWKSRTHTIRAFTCRFFREKAQGTAPVVPDWWPGGR